MPIWQLFQLRIKKSFFFLNCAFFCCFSPPPGGCQTEKTYIPEKFPIVLLLKTKIYMI